MVRLDDKNAAQGQPNVPTDMPRAKLGLLRRIYEKVCAVLSIVPSGVVGEFQPMHRPARDIPHFISLNPRVNPGPIYTISTFVCAGA